MGRQKAPLPFAPTSFSHGNYKNVGISLQNFLTFSFNPFATLVQHFKAIPSASSNLLNKDQDHSAKKKFFPFKFL